ncbi:hypothetical protein [Piscinibacter sp.]|jgi:hypothetical protein|uniref:hypothetical protein n=1 Tax=Piscinibacter sp. TaxID=1903157 RepID=UPI002F416686
MIRRCAAALVASVCLCLLATTARAQSAAPTPKAQASKPAAKTTTPRKRPSSEAKGLALATETVEEITANQLDIAARVLTGTAQCEFGQQVNIEAMAGKPGVFRLAFNKLSYTMVPQETTTGAVRLEDRKAGVVWLQIPVKSMLMNHKLGQRMVDACTQTEQRIAVEAAVQAAAAPAPAAAASGAPAASAPSAAAPEKPASAP